MPVLETYSSRLTPNLSQAFSQRANVEDFNQTGRALETASKELGEFAQKVKKIETDKQRVELGKSVSEFQLNWLTEQEKLKQEHGDKEEYAEIASKRAEEMLGAIKPGNYVTDDFEEIKNKMRVAVKEDAIRTQITVASEKQKAAFENIATNMENAARINPGNFNMYAATIAESAKSLPPELRDRYFNETVNRVKYARAQGIAEKQPGKFLADYKAGKYNDVPNADNVANFAESKIKSFEAGASKEAAVLESNLELAIKTTKDPNELLTLSQKLEQSEKVLGTVKTNRLRLDLFKQQKEANEDFEFATTGAKFATGEYSVDIKNERDVKSANKYFELREKELDSLPVLQANAERSSFISNSKFVPDAIYGKMENWARSTKEEDLTKAADLYNRVAAGNPQMLDKLASKDAMQRISLLDDRVRRGIPVKEAVQQVDALLTPRSRSEKDMLSEQLNKIKSDKLVDYNEETSGIYNSLWNYLPFTEETIDEKNSSFTSVKAAYASSFEAHYMATGDIENAKKYAKQTVSGSFSRSTVNGKPEILRYAPELYFKQFDNVSLRDVVVSAGKDAWGNSMSKINEDKIVIKPDEYYTRRSVKLGQPVYRLMYENEYGIPVPLLKPNEFITFDQNDMGKLQIETQTAKPSPLENMLSKRGSAKKGKVNVSKRGYRIVTAEELGD